MWKILLQEFTWNCREFRFGRIEIPCSARGFRWRFFQTPRSGAKTPREEGGPNCIFGGLRVVLFMENLVVFMENIAVFMENFFSQNLRSTAAQGV